MFFVVDVKKTKQVPQKAFEPVWHQSFYKTKVV
jgi:hypothetical protein